jgi:hypothetical protein
MKSKIQFVMITLLAVVGLMVNVGCGTTKTVYVQPTEHTMQRSGERTLTSREVTDDMGKVTMKVWTYADKLKEKGGGVTQPIPRVPEEMGFDEYGVTHQPRRQPMRDYPAAMREIYRDAGQLMPDGSLP